MWLSRWIARPHILEPPKPVDGGLTRRKNVVSIIDGLLRPEVLANLHPVFTTDATWNDSFGVFAAKGEVSYEKFVAAKPEDRFFHYLKLAGPPPGRPMAPGWLAWLLLQKFFASREFMHFVSAASSIEPEGFHGRAGHIMHCGHFLRPHFDRGRRALCGVFYVDDGWRAGHGGELDMLDDSAVVASVEPIGNRLVLFNPKSGYKHAVRPILVPAESWRRKSISLWWSET
jgi:hypothetical protein